MKRNDLLRMCLQNLMRRKSRTFLTVLGVLILGIIGNIMNLMGVATYPQMMIKGAIIVAAVLAKRD